MNCNDAREHLMRNRNIDLTDKGLMEHLSHCSECADLDVARQLLSESALEWEDQKPPEWDRIPMGFQHSRPTPWLQWAPLAACLLMAVLVVFRVEIRMDDSGFHLVQAGISGSSDEAELQADFQEDLQNYVDEALRKQGETTVLQFEQLLATYTNQQKENLRLTVDELTELTRGQRRQDLQMLTSQWSEQRMGDLDELERRINYLLERQNRTSSNLVQLAEYVREP